MKATLGRSKQRKWWKVAANVACKGVISKQQVVESRNEP